MKTSQSSFPALFLSAQRPVGYDQLITVYVGQDGGEVPRHAGEDDAAPHTAHQRPQLPGRHAGDVQVVQVEELQLGQVALGGEGGGQPELGQGGGVLLVQCRKSIHRFHNRLYNHGGGPY